MRTLDEMLGALAGALEGDEPRRANAWGTLAQANQVARRLPLVHRTYKPGAEDKWRELLSTRRFKADDPCTEREKAAGIPRAAYFFLGCGAYPDALVGFLLDSARVLALPSSYTPFDSGSIEKYAAPADPARAWDGPAKDRFLAEHTGRGSDVAGFGGPYLAAHFREPMTYVRLGQRSTPEFSAYHGLQSRDRRDWTIEVQVHADVPFPVGDTIIMEIVAARHALVEELPEDLKKDARLATDEDEVLESIADRILARLTGGGT
jgi:hypothetical protein